MSRRLTDQQRHEIVRRHAAGETGLALAKEFGVNPSSVCKLVQLHGERAPRLKARWREKVARARSSGRLTEFIFKAT